MQDSKQTSSRLGFVFPPLAVVLYLLIVDAAVEAVLAGVGARWWIVAGAVAFLLLTGLVWRRTDWRLRAGMATLALLALFALAGNRANDASDGLVLLGQAPPVAAAVATALVIALAGLWLAGIARLPIWARAFLGLLAIYGVLAFVLPVFTNIAYPSLLEGGGLGPRFPFWLEGGFVGALVVIPVGLIAALVLAIRSIRGAGRWQSGFKVLALGLSLLLAFETFTLPLGLASSETPEVVAAARPMAPAPGQATSAGGAEVATPTANRSVGGADAEEVSAAERALARFREQRPSRSAPIELPPEPASTVTTADARPTIDALFDEASRLRSEIDRKSFDVDAVLARTGTNLDSIFRWVRTNTRPLPYRGVLKGAQGTLMDRGGNALDRSLLLAELLERSGHTVKLANAQLTAEGREAVESIVLERLSRPPGASAADESGRESLDAEIERLAAISGQDPAAAVAYVRDVQRRLGIAREELLTQADRQSRALIETVELEKGGESQLQASLEALVDHWWVVVSDVSPARVLDLYFDPLERGLQAQGLSGESSEHAVDYLPETLFHTVTLSVVADQWSGQHVRSRKALSETFRTSEIQNQPLEVGFAPDWEDLSLTDLLEDGSGAANDRSQLQARVMALLEQETDWTPFLRAGDEVYSDSTIRTDGAIGSAKALFGTGEGLGSAIGALDSLGEVGTSGRDGQRLARVAVDLEIRSPEGRRLHSRALFDDRESIAELELDAGELRQRNARFLSGQTFLVQVGRTTEPYLAQLELENILRLRTDFRSLAASAERGDRVGALERLLSLRPPIDPTQQFALMRFAEVGPRADVALTSANVFASFTTVSLTSGRGRLETGLDIFENRVLPLAVGADEGRRASVYQGVLDTLVEDALLGFAPKRTNTALFFGRDLEQPQAVSWRAAPAAIGARLYPEVAHALGSDGEAAIQIVYSPDRMASDGTNAPFWRVDTRTGATLGLGGTGRGIAMTETLLMLLNHALTAAFFVRASVICHEALLSGDSCQLQSCVVSLTSVGVGFVGGMAALGIGVASKTLTTVGLLYKKLTFIGGAIASGTCES